MLDSVMHLITDPTIWAALFTLIIMEVVLGIDNLIFISIITNKLPKEQQRSARMIGISLALILRLMMLASIAWIVHLTDPVFTVMDHDFSWRDLILISGGLFLVWKATQEMHHHVDPDEKDDSGKVVKKISYRVAISQILMLDVIFSIDSIITAVGMTPHLPVMVTAVIISLIIMMIAANPLANFIHKHPSVVVLALSFLLMIGMTLIAEGFGAHVPKGYIYSAMAFSGFVEVMNLLTRRKKQVPKS